MAEIRLAVLKDIDAIAEIEEKSFSTPWSRDSLRDGIEDARYCFIVLTVDGKAVGYGSILPILDECDLLNLAILPEHRGKGYGKELLSALITEAKGRGAAVMHLEVRQSNERAIGLYRSFGFEVDGIRKNYYKMPLENAVLMTKTL